MWSTLALPGAKTNGSPPTSETTDISHRSHHVDHLTGANDATKTRYRRYIANDIAPNAIGVLPLTALTNADVARWLNGLAGAAKTAANGQVPLPPQGPER